MIHWYCRHCKRFITTEPQADHASHNVVGIRDDIMIGYMERLIYELSRTDRLEMIYK